MDTLICWSKVFLGRMSKVNGHYWKLRFRIVYVMLAFFLAWNVLSGFACAADDGQSNSVFISPPEPPPSGFNSYQDVWSKSQSLRPKLSLDTTFVTAKVGVVTYLIPRNYIALYLDFPILRITYPGFEPLTEETRECFDRSIQSSSNCSTLDLIMGAPLSSKQMFLNFIHNVHIQDQHRHGPFGYEVYSVGPDTAKIEYFSDEENGIFFVCTLHNVPKDAVCQDAITLEDGNSVQFFFQYDQIGELKNIESHVRTIIGRFTTIGSK